MTQNELNDRNKKIMELYRQHSEFLYKRCYLMLRDTHAAQDCLQEVFLRLSRFYANASESPNISGWLQKTAVNVCLEYIRKNRREYLYDNEQWQSIYESEDKKSIPFQEEIPELFNESDIENTTFLKSMNETDREIFDMRFCRELKITEIAGKLNCSEGTVKMRLQRLMKKAKKIYGEQM